jgi:acetylornithine deacetylase
MKDAAGILLDLVAIPSVSPMSNQPVIEYAVSVLEPQFWTIRRFPHHDAAGRRKMNLVAATHAATSVELALVCHTDTVPFDPAWAEAVHPALRDGRIYGRGSCDVKSFLACILAAAARIDLARLAKPLAIVLTADEEVGCIGAKHLVRERALASRYTIVGEPTGLRPVRAGKGYALAEILVRGKEAHSAFPERGRSAIYDAARVIGRLERVAKKLARRRSPDFDPPYTTLNAGLIQGGTAKNIVAGECRITVEWRPIPGQDPAWPARLIETELAALRRADPQFAAGLEVKRLDPAFAPSQTQHIVDLLRRLTRRAPATVSFGSEAAHLAALSSEVVVFGPGTMTVAHRSGEYVAAADLDRCVEHLTMLIERICA